MRGRLLEVCYVNMQQKGRFITGKEDTEPNLLRGEIYVGFGGYRRLTRARSLVYHQIGKFLLAAKMMGKME